MIETISAILFIALLIGGAWAKIRNQEDEAEIKGLQAKWRFEAERRRKEKNEKKKRI